MCKELVSDDVLHMGLVSLLKDLFADAVVSMCRKMKEHILFQQSPRRAILPLRTAVTKLTGHLHLVTPLHAELFQV